MTPEQKAAYIMAQTASMQARIAAMQAENQHALNQEWVQIPYTYEDFEKLPEEFGLHHNAVVLFFQE